MNKLVVILLLCSQIAYSQKNITKVGVAEYATAYLTDENKVYQVLWNGSANVFTDFGLTGVTDIAGGQYANIVLLSDGSVRVINKGGGGGANIVTYTTDSLGNPFTGNTKVYGWMQTWLTIRSGEVWYFGDDSQDYGSLDLCNCNITAPRKLGQPGGGRTVTKIVIGDQDTRSFIGLCNDGTVWKWTRGSRLPAHVSGLSNVLDIGGVSRDCFVAATATDLLAWGQFTSVVGLSDNVTTPTSILSQFTAQGLVMPLKEIANNQNILAMIDANDHLWMRGDSPQGEAGVGIELNPYRTVTPGFPFVWSFTRFQKMITTPVQVRGKWKNICSSGCIDFYFHAQGMHNEWYSWGRNKQYSLGNGLRINNEDTYPCWKTVPAPRSIDASVQTWGAEVNINPNDSLPPMANAGQDQDVVTSSATLYGDYSTQQEHAIASYAWTKISGTGGTITSPSSANTGVIGLTTGTYVFRITVTNTNGQTDTDDVKLYVDIPPDDVIRGRKISGGKFKVKF